MAAAAAVQPPAMLRLAVCGLHLRGYPLHWQLTELDAKFVQACNSAPCYRLYALSAPATAAPAKPGMLRVLKGGAAVRTFPANAHKSRVILCESLAVEVFDLPVENVGSLLSKVPPPLALGTVQLEDGAAVKGFICEGHVAEGGPGVEDITHHGGWVTYMASKPSSTSEE